MIHNLTASKRAVSPPFDQFRSGIANAVPNPEARKSYDRSIIPASVRPLFHMATANLNPRSEATANTGRHDRVSPPGLEQFPEIVPVSSGCRRAAKWSPVLAARRTRHRKAVVQPAGLLSGRHNVCNLLLVKSICKKYEQSTATAITEFRVIGAGDIP